MAFDRPCIVRGLRCYRLTYSRYASSSRLVRRAQERSRCCMRLSPRTVKLDAGETAGILSRYLPASGVEIVADLSRSHGSRLCEFQTNRLFLDFMAFFATSPIGYNHPHMTRPEVVEEMGEAALHKPSNSDLYTPEMGAFVDTFSRLALPDSMKHLFFVEGGAPAVENALKVAFDWKARKNRAQGHPEEKDLQVIHFREAFHGRLGYTLSLTNTFDRNKTRYFPKFGWPRIENPKCRFPLTGDNLESVLESEERALRQIRRVLEKNPSRVACLILEPIQGEGGDNHFRREFHRALRSVCDDFDLLFIYDEVQTGLGGTGKMWAMEHYAEPDLLAFGKKTQVCGIMANGRIDDVPENVFQVPGRINSTWGGSLVDMVRCRIYLEIYEQEGILEQARKMGRVLLEGLCELVEETPALFSNARGVGPFCAIDLPDTPTRDRFLRSLFRRRLLILPSGERSIRFRPALNMPEEDVQEGLEIFRKATRDF